MNVANEQLRESDRDGFSWPAVLLVAAVYVVFLLFAQFGFLHGVRASGHGSAVIQGVLAAMAVAGIAGSFAAIRMAHVFGATGPIALGLLLCIGATISTALSFQLGEATVGHLGIAAVGLGAGLGLATVGLAADLRRLTRAHAIATHVGAGTALAYFVCNIPAVFTASPQQQAWISAGFAVAGVGAAWFGRGFTTNEARIRAASPSGHFVAWTTPAGIAVLTAVFFSLVWFDSAAFAALQEDTETRQRLWHGDAVLWRNGVTHAVAALAAGWILDRGWLRATLATALALLIAGSLGFSSDGVTSSLAAAGYIAGVSLYSTALAACAALAPAYANRPAPIWRAAWLYAIAGWIASTAGVGCAERFGQLPSWAAPTAAGFFVIALALQPALRRPREPISLTTE